MVNKKQTELALVQSDVLDQAFNGKEAFKEKLTNMPFSTEEIRQGGLPFI